MAPYIKTQVKNGRTYRYLWWQWYVPGSRKPKRRYIGSLSGSRELGRLVQGPIALIIMALQGKLPTHDLEKLLEIKERTRAKAKRKEDAERAHLKAKIEVHNPPVDHTRLMEDWFQFEHARYPTIEGALESNQRQAQSLYEAADRPATPWSAPREELLAKAAKFDTRAMVLGATVAPSAETPASHLQSDDSVEAPPPDEASQPSEPSLEPDLQPDVEPESPSSSDTF